MITPAKLKSHTVKALAAMAKHKGVPGWHSMRKEELIKALVKRAKAEAAKAKDGEKKAKDQLRAMKAGGVDAVSAQLQDLFDRMGAAEASAEKAAKAASAAEAKIANVMPIAIESLTVLPDGTLFGTSD